MIKSNKSVIEKRFGAKFDPVDFEIATGEINGFAHPVLPVISNRKPGLVTGMEWGLLPHWAKDKTIQNNTLNCKIETAAEKPSFRDVVGNRCLVIANGFYEWKHELINGKLVKVKHLITVPDGGLFAIGGIYSNWHGQDTFTILTTEANALMAEIHNSAKRMPVVLRPEEEALWLGNEPLSLYANRDEVQLLATPA